LFLKSVLSLEKIDRSLRFLLRDSLLRDTEILSILEDHSSADPRRLIIDSTMMGLA